MPKGVFYLKLVIAEKPSVAQSIAAVLGATQKRKGYQEGNGWLVSWCFGHLAELSDATAYNPDYAKWRLQDLPILPENWQYTLGQDKREQFDTLRGLLRREDVTEVVNACDAGREGELIFRTVFCMAGCDKPLKRLWISSMEDAAIRKGFEDLRPGKNYDLLHQAALCRSRADWLVGINATRLFSLLYNHTLNIGRVMSPTLALLVQREAEIGAFKAEPFYTVALELPGVTVTGDRLLDKAAADDLQAACATAQTATVQAVERKDKMEKPPSLYDLTTLQREANRLLGFTAQQTLDYLQALYEKKLCTYPRTDSRYLTADMEQNLPDLVVSVAAAMPFTQCMSVCCTPTQVVNNAKVSDHHAIIPTGNVATAKLTDLPAGELALLKLVAARLLCAVAQPQEYTETAITVECGGHSFTARGRTVLTPGWREVDCKYRSTLKDAPDSDQNTADLPELAQGQQVEVCKATVKEGKTTPPKHYTEDSLLAAMEVAGAKDMPQDAERKGLGTPATRAAILEKLIKTGFVERKRVKKTVHLLPTSEGVALITVLPEQLQSPALTAEWEYRLKEVERGELDSHTFLDEIAALLRELVSTYKPVAGAEALFPQPEAIGKCPRCGKSVVERKKGFVCSDRSCGFALWKESKFFTAKGKKLTTAIASALLRDGRAKLTGCHSAKTGKTYDATVVMEDTGEQFVGFKLDFSK